MTALHPDIAQPHARHLRRRSATRRSSSTCVKLGVTAVELMPIHAFFDDRYLVERGLRNYWGYNTARLLRAGAALHLAPAPTSHEFKPMVRRLHEAGIEVILDVVYNHTARGQPPRPDAVASAASTTPATTCSTGRPALLLRHHRLRQHAQPAPPARAADGHGLAALLGRGVPRRRLPLRPRHDARPRLRRSSTTSSVFFDAIRQDPVLPAVKLIAEPWDLGPDGYQVGNFPPGWAEWNDRYRDTVRALLDGRRGPAADLAGACPARPTSSTTAAGARGPASTSSPPTTASRSPTSCSYNDKHNEANGEDNRDGHDDNRQLELRRRGADRRPGDPATCATGMRRNLLATLLLSPGHADAADGRRDRPHAAAATTTPIARTTRSPGCAGGR